jgi:hypothetical protein
VSPHDRPPPDGDARDDEPPPFEAFEDESLLSRSPQTGRTHPRGTRRRAWRQLGVLLAALLVIPALLAIPLGGGDGSPPPSQLPVDPIKRRAYDDCLHNVAGDRNRCRRILSNEAARARLYLDCRRADLPVGRCLEEVAPN